MTERAGEIAGLYDRWSHSYDAAPNRTRDLASVVLRTELGAIEGGVSGEVVELGCGTGRNTVWLAERARRVVALDFSAGMLEKARERVESDAVRFIQHDVRSPLPLPSASADLAVITLVLEHVEDLAPVFGECARVLWPGGRLSVCELHPYRQWAGGQAQFTETGEETTTRVPVYTHEVSEFVNAGVGAGMGLTRMGEWADERDTAEGAPPRLLSLMFERLS